MGLYLYRIQPVRPEMLAEGATSDKERIVGEHFDYLRNLTDHGVVILAGRTLNTDASSFGMIIFQAESEDAAREIVHHDPAVIHRVMRAELFPYRIALFAPEHFDGAEFG